MSFKIIILYRKNNFYKDLNDFLVKCNLQNYKLSIYNCTDEDLNHKDVLDVDNPIDTIIKSEYVDNKGVNCVILDTCIKYTDLDIVKIIDSERGYCIINYDDLKIPFILNKIINTDNMQILFDYNRDYDKVYTCKGTIDKLFYDNFFYKSNTEKYLLENILNIESTNTKVNTKTESETFLLLSKLLKDGEINEKIMLDILKNTNNDIYVVFTLINSILCKYSYNDQIIECIVDRYYIYKQNTPFIVSKDMDMYVIYNYLVDFYLDKPLFLLSDIPSWVLTGHNDNVRKFYPVIKTENTIISYPINLSDNVVISESELIINDIKYPHQSLIKLSNSQINLLKSITPITYSSVDNDKIITQQDNHLEIKNYKLIGEFIQHNNYFWGLIKEQNGSYKIVLLTIEDEIKVKTLSNNFLLDDNLDAISIKIEREILYIIASNTSHVYKCKVDEEDLFIKLLPEINNSKNPFNIKILNKNIIGLKIEDVKIKEKVNYKDYTFHSLPTKKKYFTKVDFFPKQKLVEIDKKLLYINKFIFLKLDTDVHEKTNELYFHESAKNTDFYTKSVELQISIGNDFKDCKYYVIDQDVFEKLDSAQISEIIQNRCLIISLIDEQLLKSEQLKNVYTSCESLIKLFLFNIVKNNTYINFIFSKIIHNNEYTKRYEYMNLDIENIFNENNIYQYIINNLNNKIKINIELNQKDKLLISKIKSKLLNTINPDKYKNILTISKFIVSKNFSAKIAFINIDNVFIEENEYKTILNIMFKLNWLGNIDFSVSNDTQKKYDIFIFKNKSEISYLSFSGSTLVFLIEDNLLLKID